MLPSEGLCRKRRAAGGLQDFIEIQAVVPPPPPPQGRLQRSATLCLLTGAGLHKRDFFSPRLFIFLGYAHALAPLVVAYAPQGSLREGVDELQAPPLLEDFLSPL